MFKFLAVLFLACFLAAAPGLRAQQATDTVVLRSDNTTVAIDSAVETDPPEEVGTDEETEYSSEDTVYALASLQAGDSAQLAVRTPPRDRLTTARSEDDFWYWSYREKAKQKKKAVEKDEPATRANWKLPAGWFWAFVAVGILTLIYLLLKSMNIDPFARRPISVGGDEEDEVHEDIFNRNYEREVEKALAEGNHRLAVRLHYLQLLRELSDRNIIQYRPGATNGVYVGQLWGTPFYGDFFRITRTFEYAWYGMLPVTETAYQRMQEDIAHLKTRFA